MTFKRFQCKIIIFVRDTSSQESVSTWRSSNQRESNHFENSKKFLGLYSSYVENISNRAVILKYSSSLFLLMFSFFLAACSTDYSDTLVHFCDALYVNWTELNTFMMSSPNYFHNRHSTLSIKHLSHYSRVKQMWWF